MLECTVVNKLGSGSLLLQRNAGQHPQYHADSGHSTITTVLIPLLLLLLQHPQHLNRFGVECRDLWHRAAVVMLPNPAAVAIVIMVHVL